MPREHRLAAQTTHPAMGTVMAHRAFGLCAEECLEAVCREVARLEGLLSRFRPDSEISRLNRSAGVGSEKVSLDTYEVLSRAVEYAGCCSGCFDVTIGPLVAVWSAAKESGAQPDERSIRQVLPLVNYRDLILEPWELTAALRYPGQSIDLGGIGKGYAGDRIRDVYRQYGVSAAYSNLGGNVVTWRAGPDGSPWRIGIQHPRQEDRLLGCVSVADQAVVTSGDYQRCFIDSAGQRHHHILNPATGYPADAGLISVSIVADSSTAADALSTVVFVAGMERGLELLQDSPGVEAILVDQDLRVYVTSGLQDRFQADAGLDVHIVE